MSKPASQEINGLPSEGRSRLIFPFVIVVE